MRRVLQIATLLAAIGLIGPAAATAVACPMCKEAVESTGNALPKAYMYSILFMLGVPATVLTSFSIGMYRMSKSKPPAPAADEEPLDD